MKVKEIRALVKEFSQSLKNGKDDKDMDEWWGTNKDIWDGISKKFLNWCERNRKKIENQPINSSEAKV